MNSVIPKSSLEKWGFKKFYKHQSTMELMASAKNNHDLAVIAIVALMDVKPSNRYQGLNEEEVQYQKTCHNYLRPWIKGLMIKQVHSAL